MTARRLGVSVVLVALVCATVVHRAFACVRSFAKHRVRGSFVVQIAYNGRPLKGVELKLSRETHKEPYFIDVLSAKSDGNGEISINGLAPDAYFLEIKHAGTYGEAVELSVVGHDQQDALVEDRLKLKWPDTKVFKAHKIAGVLVRTPFDFTKRVTEPPLVGANLTLIDAFPATQLGTFVVGTDGKFSFPNLSPGLYIVQVKQDKKIDLVGYLEDGIEGDIFVEIAPNAAEQEIPILRLYMSDCGMGMRGKDGNEIF